MKNETLEKFFTVSNAIEGIHDHMDVDNWVQYWHETNEMTHEVAMFYVHAKMDYLNDYCKAGEYRTYKVYVGGRECSDYRHIPANLAKLFAWFPSTANEAKDWHIAFEHIHPFGDGNGRIGRFLYLRHLEALSLPVPYWLTSMNNFEENRQRYYKWFLAYKY